MMRQKRIVLGGVYFRFMVHGKLHGNYRETASGF
jgi:hypothetical protein